MADLDKKQYFNTLSIYFGHGYLDFLALVHKHYDIVETQEVLKAYRFAKDYHHNQKRKDGSPYMTHPQNVAYILIKAGFDYQTACAALLHDVVEDTSCTLDDIRENFGDTIAALVDGVTKMKGSDFNSLKEEKIATHKKILDSITKDARIIAVKLADRLHNMYTLDFLDKKKQEEIARETLDFYVNLARILGVYQIKDELQDLCLYTLKPDEFKRMFELRTKLKKDHFEEYKYIGEKTKEGLSYLGVDMNYNYKIKNIGSIYQELLYGKNEKEIRDLLAIRMIVKDIANCYQTLGVVHNICMPIEGSFVDYISYPKYNGYRSLNTNVKTYKDSEFQVRIRTTDMQRTNELGIISNWTPETQRVLNDKCYLMLEENKKEQEAKKLYMKGLK